MNEQQIEKKPEDSTASNSTPLLERRLKENYTLSRAVVMEDEPDARTVWLKVGSQEFCVADAENKEHAEWMRDMLAKALGKIVNEQRTF